MTTYTVFMHYYNDSIGRAVTNTVNCDWYSCLTTPKEYDSRSTSEHSYLQLEDMSELKLEQGKESLEHMYISIKGSRTVTADPLGTEKYENLIVKSSTINNPKYDMIFVWDGLGYFTHETDTESQLYFDKTKRIKIKPWFFHSTYHSLKSAMTKAEQLIDLFGKDHIMIGKEVPLDQYIDIV